jgi:Family of unknown function (DUF6134)
MACTRCPRAWLVRFGLVAVSLLMLGLPPAWAADGETRAFTVQVDGKKVGDYRLTIQRQADGSVAVSAQSDVRVTLLGIPVYTYSYRGVEVWKGGCLQHLQSSGKEKGKDFAVRAVVDGTALRVQANGKERRIRADVWTSSCWQLPAPQFRNNSVVLLGCDTGAETASRLQYVGIEQIAVAGQTQACSHYRVMKDAPHDLWYDGQERLVREEWVADGHRTVLELVGLQR